MNIDFGEATRPIYVYIFTYSIFSYPFSYTKGAVKMKIDKTRLRKLSYLVVLLFLIAVISQNFLMAFTADIHSSNTDKSSSTMSAGTTNDGYKYSGKYTNNNKVTMFDYVSDYELQHGYNNCNQKEEGYVDAYTVFNQAISQSNIASTPKYSANNNITILFKPKSTQFAETDSIWVHIWRGDGNPTTSWPGIQMTYDFTENQYFCTFNPTSYGFTPANRPNKVIFNNGGKGNSMPEIYKAMDAGKTYKFDQSVVESRLIRFKVTTTDTITNVKVELRDDYGNSASGDMTLFNGQANNDFIYDTRNISFTPTKIKFTNINNNSNWNTNEGDLANNNWDSSDGYIYECKYIAQNTIGGTNDQYRYQYPSDAQQYVIYESSDSENIYDTLYTNPLYFGCFWKDNYASGYSSSNAPAYNNFKWQANMGLKSQTGAENNSTSTATNHFNYRGEASTQGLVYGTLLGGSRGNLLDANGTTELPYFDEMWARQHNNLMKYYDTDANDDGDITFPFYEVTTALTNVTISANANKDGEKARFYQFKAADSNLQFNYNTSNPDDHKGYFSESSTQIQFAGNPGFFPFNTSDSKNSSRTNDHNLGFGAKFEMDFQLEPDGCVGPVTCNDDGTNVKDKDSTTRIHTIFEFEGDDDLWVFIDGKLVLDMGGDHNKSHGIIDFAAKTATVDKAISIGAGSGVNDLSADIRTPSTNPSSTISLSTLMADSITHNNTTNKDEYTSKTHTMTVFYMERGMMDSNLLIRFNYSPTPNFSRMKIAEVTKFDNVNAGLKTLTQVAAETDIFKYTVSNTGTTAADVLANSAKYPTIAEYTRTPEGDPSMTTTLTPNGTLASGAEATESKYDPPSSISTPSRVVNTSYLWVDKFATDEKMVGKTTGTISDRNNGGDLFLMYGTNDSVYDKSNTGKESSAEFEKQFKKGSTMQIVQGTTPYLLTRTPAVTSHATLYNASNGAINAANNSSRSLASYYTTTNKIVDRNGNEFEPNGDGSFIFSNITAAINPSAANPTDENLAVMLTEYFINQVNTGAISVTKSLDPDDNVSDAFTFQVDFDGVFGVAGVDATDYSTVEVVKTNPAETTTLTSTGTFTLVKGQTATISGIPYGTAYSITESSPSVNYQQKSVTGTLSGTTDTTTKSGTVVNTRLTNSLTLRKTVTGTDAPTNQTFTFNVTLTAPTGVDLSNYVIKQKIGGGEEANFTSPTVFTMQAGTDVVISGIPYGTQYSVTETGTLPRYWSVTSGNTQTGTIGSTASTAEITNNYSYPVGSLSLQKSLVGNAGTSVGTSTPFEFEIRLQNSTRDLTKFMTELPTGSEVTQNNPNDFKFKVNVTAGDNPLKTVNNIPVGTTYIVSETTDLTVSPFDISWSSDSPKSGTIQTENTTYTATITNTHQQTGKLILDKDLFTTQEQNAFGSTSFDYTVVLQNNNVNLKDYITNTPIEWNGESAGVAHQCTIVVGVTHGSNVEITNIPYGTSYTVSENISGTNWQHVAASTSGLSGSVNSSTPSPTAKITNTYKTGELKLQKLLGSGTSTSDYGSKLFTFNVTLTNNSVDLTKYFTNGTSGCTSVSSNEATFSFSNVTYNDVNSTLKSITNIPYGTTYAVSEGTLDTGWSQTAASNISGTINSNEITAQITNSYSQRSLSLTKVDENNSSLKLANAQFVLLKLKADFNESTARSDFESSTAYTALSSYYDGFDTNSGQNFKTDSNGNITVTTFNGSAIADGNYFFYEVTAPDGYNVNNNPIGHVLHISSSSATASDTRTDPRKTADLTLKKQLAGDYGNIVNNDTKFKYTVTLEAPEKDTANVIDLTNYNITIGGTAVSATYESSNHQYVISNIEVSKNSSVTIAGLPYGTKYTVVEQTENLPDTNGMGTWGTPSYDANRTGTIDANGTDVTTTVTNTFTRSKGKLVLNKALAGGYTYHTVPDNFTFNVELTPPSGISSLDSYGITGAVIGTISGNKYSFNVSVPKTGNVEINNIPYGTKYTVSETNGANYTSSGSVTNHTLDSASKSVTITNTYTYPEGTLTLKKELVKTGYMGTEVNDTTPFTFHVTLSNTDPGVDLSTYGIGYNNSSRVTIVSSSANQYVCDVEVKSGDVDLVKITKIPYGTTYTVTETTVKQDWSKSGEVTTSATIDSSNSKGTVTITNTYDPYTIDLLLQKRLEGGSSIPSGTDNDTLFVFNVHLEGLGNITSIAYEGHDSGTATVTDGEADFTVNVSASQAVTIKNVPKTAYYKITENITRNNLTVIGENSGNVKLDLTNNTVVITNTYSTPPSENSVTLTKTDSQTGSKISSGAASFTLYEFGTLPSDFFESEVTKSQLSAAGTIIESGLKLDSSGQITVSGNDTIKIGKWYMFFEDSAPSGYIINNYLNINKFVQVTDLVRNANLTYTNDRHTTETDVEKVDKDNVGTKLSGAEFELYYKENTDPPTYSINDPVIAPMLAATSNLVDTNKPSVPSVQKDGTETVTMYNYDSETPPSSSNENWILPRTDNDYIYFRDFEPGTGEWDPGFGDSSDKNGHAWLKTWPGTNEHGQSKEICYDQQNHNYWFAAQFSASGKSTVEYAVWERFLDQYNGLDTVVWKIQPPDGYTDVRFLLYDGSNCIRTTTKFTYQLGKVYTKTSWGGQYANQNGNNCYFNVPVDGGVNLSSYYGSVAQADGGTDMRNQYTNSAGLKQADRYIDTPQKIVFHCNSKIVWHNIHIEFFSDESGSIPIGQKAPGYMMEPYAHADKNTYRINGYLTYELTIPEGAKSFRINNGNGESSGTYGYNFRTAVTKLYNDTTNNPLIEGKNAALYKNYHNYFMLKNGSESNVTNGCSLELTNWPNSFIRYVGDNPDESYKNTEEIESDYDYVYFAAPSDWNGHVYAYFYGGGDLRKDNWQRACYSIWPGLAPVGAQYNDGTQYNSDIYTYSHSGSLNNSTDNGNASNPDTTFKFTKNDTKYTVYKLRVPLGDRINYDHVIFNDGLSLSNGGHETKVIQYAPGNIYFADRSTVGHFKNNPTTTYTGRGDYLYVRTTGADTANYDDLHVTFYYSNNAQMLQGGDGYVMKYSGTNGGYTYYKIPIPAGAAKFKVNNGYDQNMNIISQTSEMGEIFELNASGNENISQTFTKRHMVYTLSGSTLTKAYPQFNESGTTQTNTSTDPYPSPRGDYIYISGLSEKPTVKFYDSSDAEITTASDIKVNKHQTSDSQWYSVGIPLNAKTFSINAETTKYPVYDKVSAITGEGQTTGGMYYSASGTALTLTWPEFVETPGAGYAAYSDDNSYTTGLRGDALYLVSDDLDTWGGMTVTFYKADGTPISNGTTTDIHPNYIGHLAAASDSASAVPGETTAVTNAVGCWFKVNIPEGAATFVAKNGGVTSAEGKIYRLRGTTSPYRNDYTLGNMQYRISNTGALTLFYPLFTENPAYSMPGHDDITSTSGITLIEENQTLMNEAAQVPGSASSTDDSPILYPTSSDTVTYQWTEGTEDTNIYFEKPSTWSGTPKIYLYNSSNSKTSWDASPEMTYVSGNVYKYDVGSDNWKYVVFRVNDTDRYPANGINWDISAFNYGKGKIFRSTTTSGNDTTHVYFQRPEWKDNSNNYYWGENYAYFWKGSTNSGWDSATKSEVFGTVTANNTTYSNVWQHDIPTNFTPDNLVFYNQKTNATYYVKTSDLTYKAGYLYKLSANPSGSISTSSDSRTAITAVEVGQVQTGTTSWSIEDYSGAGSTATYTSQYQPEDRYGYINDVASLSDYTTDLAGTNMTTNNFIKIVDEYDNSGTPSHYLADPYIIFYSDTAGTTRIDTVDSTVSGSSLNSKGISVKSAKLSNTGAQPGSGLTSDPYIIRLPKAAKSVKLFDGTTQIGGLITLDNDGGSTLTVTKPESVYVLTKIAQSKDGGASLTSDARKTDSDYIYYKGDEFGSNIHAYFYGDTNGEFSAWPGTEPAFSYKDNSDNTVYAFQIPSINNVSSNYYPYVIFNDGAAYLSSTKMSTAQNATGGVVYSKDSGNVQYGTTPDTQAYVLTSTTKTSAQTANYSMTGTNGQYVFFINNGTKNLISHSSLSDDRYVLDDVHIIFYTDAQGVNAIGSGQGEHEYKLDKLSDETETYRIQIPAGAKYFRITNGQGKGGVSGYNNYRKSEVKELTPNGIYQFVASAASSEGYINGTVPTSLAEISTPEYLLELTNERNIVDDIEEPPVTEKYDVLLARIVTGADGKTDKITWLKPAQGHENEIPQQTVDSEYLNNTIADLNVSGRKVITVKTGDYYWKEITAPTGYEISTETQEFVISENTVSPSVTQFGDEKSKGAVQLTKIAGQATAANGGTALGENLGAGYGFLLYQVGSDGSGTLVSGVAKKANKSEYYYVGTNAAAQTSMASATDTSNNHIWEVSGSSLVIYNKAGSDENASNGEKTTVTSANGTAIIDYKYVKPLLTDNNGIIYIENLPVGSYYLEEVITPDQSYSNNMIHGWLYNASTQTYSYDDRMHNEKDYSYIKNRVDFVVAANNTDGSVLELTCKDQKTPAYIRLFEHINEYRPNEWGDPTFIFKIKQTHTYSDSNNDPRNAIYTPIDDGKEYIVALTVDDHGKMSVDTFTQQNENTNYKNWFLETTAKNYSYPRCTIVGNTDDSKYANERMFGLNSEGMLEVEPGKYTISRLNTSRYEFVTNYYRYWTSQDNICAQPTYDSNTQQYKIGGSNYYLWYNGTSPGYDYNPSKNGAYDWTEGETMTLKLEPYRFADIHYYDKVAYYDKYSHNDTEVNNFYTVNETGGGINAVKGIRVEYRGRVPVPTSGNAVITVNTAENKNRLWNSLSEGNLDAYFINADGTERAMTQTEKQNLVISYNGTDETFRGKFSFNSANSTITISDPQDYCDHVYTLTAAYNGYDNLLTSTTFDIAFASNKTTP